MKLRILFFDRSSQGRRFRFLHCKMPAVGGPPTNLWVGIRISYLLGGGGDLSSEISCILDGGDAMIVTVKRKKVENN